MTIAIVLILIALSNLINGFITFRDIKELTEQVIFQGKVIDKLIDENAEFRRVIGELQKCTIENIVKVLK
jgi:hypothetical protein